MDTSVGAYWRFQLASLGWMLIGIPVLLVLAICKYWYRRDSKSIFFPNRKVYAWEPAWAWRWNNEEDGVIPPTLVNGEPYMPDSPTWVRAYVWSAFRNSCAGMKAEMQDAITAPVTIERHRYWTILRSGPYWCVFVGKLLRFGWLLNVRSQFGDRTGPTLENLKGVELP